MAKNSYVYFCSECGYESSKWMGQCPGCKAWNSFIEEKVTSSTKGKSTKTGSYRDAEKSPSTLSEISTEEEQRLQIGINELDRVLGGGIVKGSLILLGGEPGIGKSTLLLQLSELVAKKDIDVLYVTGEDVIDVGGHVADNYRSGGIKFDNTAPNVPSISNGKNNVSFATFYFFKNSF